VAVGIRTDIDGYIFDAFLKIDHERRLTMTDHPVEEGANITDHAYLEPKAVSMEIGMSDVCSSIVDGQFQERPTRSISAFATLERLQEERRRLTINTKLATYKNMLIDTITVPDDYTTMYGMKATVFFREIIVAMTDTVTLPNRTSRAPHKTGNTNTGTVQPSASEANRSTLDRAGNALFGNSLRDAIDNFFN